MTWVRLDDGFFTNPKAITAGRDGRALFLAGCCYCGSNDTDGVIIKAAVRQIAALAEVRPSVADSLVAAGLWHDEGGHYEVHDWLKYNRPRSVIEAERDAARERMARTRSRRSSGEQPPNVQAKFEGSSPYPVPARPSKSKENPQPPPLGGGTATQRLDLEFAEWWPHYPRRTDKAAARKKFTAARKAAGLDVLIAGADAYAASLNGNDPQYTKYPATWLNNKCWENGTEGPKEIPSCEFCGQIGRHDQWACDLVREQS